MPGEMVSSGMVLDLLKIDHDHALQLETRFVEIAAGDRRFIAARRLTWRWFDYLCAYEFCPPADVIFADMLRHAQESGLALGDALGAVVTSYVDLIERSGGDVTDDDIDAVIAAKAAILRSARR